MAPTPQEPVMTAEPGNTIDGDQIVISGMAGLYPDSENIKELRDILYNKVHPVSETNCRWSFTHPEVRQKTGKVPGLDLFDAQFFRVNYRLANCMDAMSRKMLEQAYQAIYDAGMSLDDLAAYKTGVFVGACFSETEKACFYINLSYSGMGIAGCNRSMFANRISYWLNAKGPSMSFDGACCASTVALEQAYQAITRGACDAAVVTGSNLCLHPHSNLHYGRIIKLSQDGKTRSFDQNSEGTARSEVVSVIFLQKAKHAKRIYAEIVHVKTEHLGLLKKETGPVYGFYRNPDLLANFIRKFYQDAKVSPSSVEYVEAFGSATPDADKQELDILDEVYCRDRTKPLQVGSIMSNIGYCEAASGVSAITKVLLAYETGIIAGNLDCEIPRQDVAAIREGRIQIVQDHKPFNRGLVAINQMSYGGLNGHVLLRAHYKAKDLNRYKASIPRLVTISGRQDTAIQKILDDLKSRPIDPEEHALFHSFHSTRVSGHLGRGYIILDQDSEGKTVVLSEKKDYFDDASRPLWFVYSGMGSQWAGMGTHLLRIPVFAAAIEKCRRALEPKGIDIIKIITSPDKSMFDNILHSFIGIAAIQIGLTDILTSLGIKPDKIIGHSVGELGCAYADGCFTAEEMILSAYSRGLVSIQTPFIRGSMAAVGIGYQEIVEMVPPEIEVACHNGPESSTISGPADIMKDFVVQLTAKGVFAKEVPCSNIAYHSRYIADAGPDLLKYLSEVIKDPKPRSERWVSTSVPQDKWEEPLAKYSSAEYHTNNLLNQVLFEETSRLIPANAVCIEIAPHGLLQAILKRSLPESCKHIPMTRRGHPDNVLMVLDSIGKLFMEGYYPKVSNLYPKVEFPVSSGTPMLSHLVEWAHHEKWKMPLYQSAIHEKAPITEIVVSLHDEFAYLRGNVLRGKPRFPFAAALVAVWDTYVMSQEQKRMSTGVRFSDLQLYGQPALHENSQLKFFVRIHRANGWFEIQEGDQNVATGYVMGYSKETARLYGAAFESSEPMDITEDDVYQMLADRDCIYSDDFKTIKKTNKSFTEAEIVWKDNWITFLDGILQLHCLRNPHDSVTQPFQIRDLEINLNEHENVLHKLSRTGGVITVPANIDEHLDTTRCGGVLMQGLQCRKLNPIDEESVVFKSSNFIPRLNANIDVYQALQVYLQIVAENIGEDVVNVVAIINNKDEIAIFNQLRSVLDSIPGIKINFETINRDKILSKGDELFSKVNLLLVNNIAADENICEMLFKLLKQDTFLINGQAGSEKRIRPSAVYRVVSEHQSNGNKLELIKWRPTAQTAGASVVTVRKQLDFNYLKASRASLPEKQKLVILTTYPPPAGLKNLVAQWRKGSERNLVSLVMISDSDDLEQLPELDLAYNVLIDGVWGGEYHISCQETSKGDRELMLRSAHIGDLDSLHWVEAGEPVGDGIPVNVHYTALNYLDAKIASGEVPVRDESEISYCMDFSGVTDRGERVMGAVLNGAASTRVKAHKHLTWPVPKHWSLEDAATVPSAYLHALYCFGIKLKFQRNLTVLVHGGTGALGQASISIALASGCEVFTTVSSMSKKRFLMRLFPDLKEEHIGNSRDRTFADMVRSITQKGVTKELNPKGCNVVISCVKPDLKEVSMNCMSMCSILFDTTQLLNQEHFNFGMHYLTMERNYHAIDFTSIMKEMNDAEMKQLHHLVSEGIARGYVRPLSRVTYSPDEVPRAFKLLAASRHRGRVVLKLKDSIKTAEPRIICSPDLTHVVLSDGHSLGLHLAERLIERGARKLHVHCTNPTKYLTAKVESWEAKGVNVQLSSEDLASSKAIVSLLSRSNEMAPVEGIYIITTDVPEHTAEKMDGVVANLDFAARKLCPSVRYFAVINADLSVGLKTCISRSKDDLPATSLNLAALKKPGSAWWRTAVAAIERALCNSQVVLTAHVQTPRRQTLLQQIAAVAGIRIPKDCKDTTNLLELGMHVDKISAVIADLRNRHDVTLTEKDVPELTIQKIKELETKIYGQEFPVVKGLGNFFSYVDSDEMLATTAITFLPTRTHILSTLRSEEFDVTLQYLCIVPGLEGHHHRFRVLCDQLKIEALILQPGLDDLQETHRGTAERYAKTLLSKTSIGDNFFLLGYESGVATALELASILEYNGSTGTVFCIGGTPEEFQAELERQLSGITTDDELQDAVARHMFSLMTGNADGLDEALKTASSWEEKINICVRKSLGKVKHSAQYARNLLDAAYTRINRDRVHTFKPRELKSKIIFMRAKGMTTENNSAQQLQKYSKQPVIVYELEESLANCTLDLRCSAIVNRHLDPKLLQEYEEKNKCENYLLNSEQLMMILE